MKAKTETKIGSFLLINQAWIVTFTSEKEFKILTVKLKNQVIIKDKGGFPSLWLQKWIENSGYLTFSNQKRSLDNNKKVL